MANIVLAHGVFGFGKLPLGFQAVSKRIEYCGETDFASRGTF